MLYKLFSYTRANRINYIKNNVRSITISEEATTSRILECSYYTLTKSKKQFSKVKKKRINLPFAEITTNLITFTIAYNNDIYY